MMDSKNRDLQHFLRLARAQVSHKEKLARQNSSEPQQANADRLRLLEELIKEQIVDENSHSATRATR